MHGITRAEEAEIVAVFHKWSDIDRFHRKLAHRGSWLGRFWCDPSTVRRVLASRGLMFHPPKRTVRSEKKPIPEWVTFAPNKIWIGDITSSEETSAEVQAVLTRALRSEGLLDGIEELAASDKTMSLDP
ncbi:MAG: hypothetical protein LH624_13955 [Cryobacterium sp.]|nr:hypothetical protein [Cryobacterium sp.]